MADRRRQRQRQHRQRMSKPAPVGVWERPAMKDFARRVIDEMEPKLASSAVSMMLAPKGDRIGNVKFWVEIGASIMHDKPIIVVVFDDQPVPSKLAAVADEIVRMPEGIDSERGQADLKAAIERVLARLAQVHET